MLANTKNPLSSLTITSAAVASVLDAVGIHIGDRITAADLNSIIAAVAALMAIYGRLRATARISTGSEGGLFIPY